MEKQKQLIARDGRKVRRKGFSLRQAALPQLGGEASREGGRRVFLLAVLRRDRETRYYCYREKCRLPLQGVSSHFEDWKSILFYLNL